MAPTDQELIAATNEILKNCDITLLTAKSIRLQLEVIFGCELAEAKTLIRTCLENFMDKNEDAVLYAAKVKTEIAAEPEAVELSSKKRRGFAAEVQLSTELAEFLGEYQMPRTEVTKRVWAYIKLHDLQNPKDKREILCDAALLKVLKRNKIHMFQMTKVLSGMMKSPDDLQDAVFDDDDEDNGEARPAKKSKTESNGASNSSSSSSSKAKKSPSKTDKKKSKTKDKVKKAKKEKKSRAEDGEEGSSSSSGKKPSLFMRPMDVNPVLAGLIGVGTSCSRPDVVKNLWVYIREHNLQNPSDKREILLNKPLQDLFKAKKCTMFSINKLLSSHLSKAEVKVEEDDE